MVFWIAVLVGAFFAWIAVQVGFYAAWMMFFNILLSAYLAIFLSPVIIDNVPAATDTPYGYTLVFLCIAAATMILSYGVCYAFLSGQLRFDFPKIFDTIGAGIVGFLAGFMAWSMLSFSFALLPLWELDSLRSLGFEASSQRANTAYMCWWCDLLHTLTSSSENEISSAEAVELLVTRVSFSAGEAPPSDDAGGSSSGAADASKRGPAKGGKAGSPAGAASGASNPAGAGNPAGAYGNRTQAPPTQSQPYGRPQQPSGAPIPGTTQ
jgi:hypothetical protein